MRLSMAVALLFLCSSSLRSQPVSDELLRAKAQQLANDLILIDTHIDVPDFVKDKPEDLSHRTPDGEFDFVRAVQGGLDAPFAAIYVPSEEETKHTAKQYADNLIDMVESWVHAWPDKFALVRMPSDILAHSKRGLVSLPLGMENGAPIEGKIGNVQYFYDRGIRYITLTHAKDNHICDSSYDTTRTWHGLSPFGKLVVAEMNRVGIMVDVSHISDDSFYQVMQISKAPVIASHSSCRYFTPGFERNMSDEMIQLLAKNGGTIQINFGSDFLRKEIRDMESRRQKEIAEYLRQNHLKSTDSSAEAYEQKYEKDHPLPYADVKDVAIHIDHVAKLVGIDHVGIGSDFDGLGDALPTGLKDVSQYPNLIYELLKMGYSESDIQKICSGNIVRVWNEVERVASDIRAKKL
ncbi:MAG TPA: dipeptidase [Bacteroidota bacterium]|nr:dipeptidase [Bacteroidota bacterium]